MGQDRKPKRKWLISLWVGALALGLCLALPGALWAGAAKLEGDFTILKFPSTHKPGKVQIAEFADFYCPHCHMFEQTAVPMLEEEFGNKVELTMVGYPVIRGMLPTPFLMYEQAKAMGKGREMKNALFRTIHRDQTSILDRTIRAALAKEVGLDPVEFEKRFSSGGARRAFAEGKQWGERIEIHSTPTILLDGNIKIEGEHLNPDNVKTVIRSILAADKK